MIIAYTHCYFQQNITFDVENGLAQMGDTNDAETKTQTITIKMTLNNAETTALEEVQGLNFTISLNKLAKIKGTTDGYYMTMGSNVVIDSDGVQQVQPVKWIPFAESTDGTTWTVYDNTNKPNLNNQYYFWSEKILDAFHGFNYEEFLPGYDESSFEDNFLYGIPYNHTFTGNMDDEYPTLYANNYLASTIRGFLNGETLVDYELNFNFLQENGMSGYLFNKITARPAVKTEEVINGLYEYQEGEVAVEEFSNQTDKLWLFNSSIDIQNINQLAMPSSEMFRHEGTTAGWWARDTIFNAYKKAMVGGTINDRPQQTVSQCCGSADDMPFGIRPAFQFDLSK